MLFGKVNRLYIQADTISSKQTIASWVNLKVHKRLIDVFNSVLMML